VTSGESEALTGPRPDRGDWIRVGILAVVFVVMFLPALRRMLYVFVNDDNYSYGFFIPVVSAFYVYMNWPALSKVRTNPSWLGAPALVLSALGYLAFASLNPPQHYLMQVFMLGTILSLTVLLFGWSTLRAYAFPLLYLLLMFPLPKAFEEQYITLPLQRYAAATGASVIDACGIPVVRDGNVIRVPAMDLLVEEACSGIRSLFSLTALSVAMVWLFEKRWWEKILLIALTPAIAVLANVIRVSSTGMLATWVSPDFASGFLHYFQGLAIFALGMTLLLTAAWIVKVLIPPPESAPEAPAEESATDE